MDIYPWHDSTLRHWTDAADAGTLSHALLVHGGEGTAFREWAELWAKRGYAAIAMDLAGCGRDP